MRSCEEHVLTCDQIEEAGRAGDVARGLELLGGTRGVLPAREDLAEFGDRLRSLAIVAAGAEDLDGLSRERLGAIERTALGKNVGKCDAADRRPSAIVEPLELLERRVEVLPRLLEALELRLRSRAIAPRQCGADLLGPCVFGESP